MWTVIAAIAAQPEKLADEFGFFFLLYLARKKNGESKSMTSTFKQVSLHEIQVQAWMRSKHKNSFLEFLMKRTLAPVQAAAELVQVSKLQLNRCKCPKLAWALVGPPRFHLRHACNLNFLLESINDWLEMVMVLTAVFRVTSWHHFTSNPESNN